MQRGASRPLQIGAGPNRSLPSVILSPNSGTSETKRKPVSRLSKKRPQAPNSCSTSQFSQIITQELPSTSISNAKQKSTRGGARLTRADPQRRERQDSAALEELKTSSSVSASLYTLALPTFISDSDEEFYILPRSLSDESIQLYGFWPTRQHWKRSGPDSKRYRGRLASLRTETAWVWLQLP